MTCPGIRQEPALRAEVLASPPALQDAPTVSPEAMPPEGCALAVGRSDFLPLLQRMTQPISQPEALSVLLCLLLRLMQQQLGLSSALISLHEPDVGHSFLHESLGLSADRLHQGRWMARQTSIEQVLRTGRTLVIPEAAQGPSFLCIPIMRTDGVLGSISAEGQGGPEWLQRVVQILRILAATLAQSVELYLLEQLRQPALEAENRRLRAALRGRFKPTSIIGSSKPMRAVYRMLEKVTRAKTTVLILGETGVGKELVASAIHYNGPWASGPFVSFNCAAMSEAAVESELFGHEPGLLGGATYQRRGRFEQADGGTLFLDEVSELSLPMQAKLLRVIEEKSFERVGGNLTIQVELRIVAASSRNLKQRVAEGRFRDDLYYRLNVFPIQMPPLRERGADVLSLAEHFIERCGLAMGIAVPGFSPEALHMLTCYHWPGNVRELKHVIERAMRLSAGQLILPEHLPPSLQPPQLPGAGHRGVLDARLGLAERAIIIDALTQTRGNTSEAALQLGLTRRMLGLRMAKYQLSYKDYRK